MMSFKVKHNLFGLIPGTNYLHANQNYVSIPFRQPYILDRNSMYSTTRKVCHGKNRRENVSLIRTMELLKENSEISLRKYREEKSNLEQIVHHLTNQREGKRRFSYEVHLWSLFKNINFIPM